MKKRQIFAGIAAIFILLLFALAFTACPTETEVGNSFTVTFDSNGGSAIASVSVEKDQKAAKPADPTIIPGGAKTSRFRGWYTDYGTFNSLYDFASPITANITLYADWGYRPGEAGPSGGIIFYRDDEGFTMPDDNTTAYYLEAAPQDQGVLGWVEIGKSPPAGDITGYFGRAIGTGRKNTAVILGRDAAAPAAKACNDLGNGYYLPSRDELNELYKCRVFFTNLKTGIYWTSTQFDYQFIWNRNFGSGQERTNQNGAYNIRAIRAF